MSAGLVTVILAPGTTAPDGSFTVPCIPPVVSCANAVCCVETKQNPRESATARTTATPCGRKNRIDFLQMGMEPERPGRELFDPNKFLAYKAQREGAVPRFVTDSKGKLELR